MPGLIALPADSYVPPPGSSYENSLLVNVNDEPSPTPSSLRATDDRAQGPRTFSRKVTLATSIAMFIFIFMTTFLVVFALLRFSVSVVFIAAIATLWETASTGSFPGGEYFTTALIEYIRVGAVGACMFAVAFGLVLTLAVAVLVLSPRLLDYMQEMLRREKALVETAKVLKPTKSRKRCLYASVSFLSTLFIVVGVAASQRWSGGSLEPLMRDPRRSLAAAILGDLLVSLWTCARIYMRGEEVSEDVKEESEKARILEEVVIGASNV